MLLLNFEVFTSVRLFVSAIPVEVPNGILRNFSIVQGQTMQLTIFADNSDYCTFPGVTPLLLC